MVNDQLIASRADIDTAEKSRIGSSRVQTSHAANSNRGRSAWGNNKGNISIASGANTICAEHTDRTEIGARNCHEHATLGRSVSGRIADDRTRISTDKGELDQSRSNDLQKRADVHLVILGGS